MSMALVEDSKVHKTHENTYILITGIFMIIACICRFSFGLGMCFSKFKFYFFYEKGSSGRLPAGGLFKNSFI